MQGPPDVGDDLKRCHEVGDDPLVWRVSLTSCHDTAENGDMSRLRSDGRERRMIPLSTAFGNAFGDEKKKIDEKEEKNTEKKSRLKTRGALRNGSFSACVESLRRRRSALAHSLMTHKTRRNRQIPFVFFFFSFWQTAFSIFQR